MYFLEKCWLAKSKFHFSQTVEIKWKMFIILTMAKKRSYSMPLSGWWRRVPMCLIPHYFTRARSVDVVPAPKIEEIYRLHNKV